MVELKGLLHYPGLDFVHFHRHSCDGRDFFECVDLLAHLVECISVVEGDAGHGTANDEERQSDEKENADSEAENSLWAHLRILGDAETAKCDPAPNE